MDYPERLWKDICKLVDKTAGVFGASSNLSSKIDGRIGVLKISSPQFSVTKLLYQIGGKQPSNYIDMLSADRLYTKYHYINEVDRNFKKIYRATVPFSEKDFNSLQGKNYINDLEGNLLEIINFEWINKNELANIEYSTVATESTRTKTVKIYG